MTTLRRVPAVFALLIVAGFALSGCSAAENVVNGVVSEASDQVGEAVDGAVDSAKSQFDDAVSDALGGAGISTDGELPKGFPVDDVPLVGTVEGGGAGPDSTGWVARTTLTGDESFESAGGALEDAGFDPSAVNSDTDSGFGTYSGTGYTVLLTVGTTDAVMTATYVVTKK